MDQFRIAELAERTGFSRPTLRYYEEIGLLAPERADAGYRIYDRRDEERLRFHRTRQAARAEPGGDRLLGRRVGGRM